MSYVYQWFGGDLHGIVDSNTKEILRFFIEKEAAQEVVARSAKPIPEAADVVPPQMQEADGVDRPRVEAVNQLSDAEIKLIADRMAKGEDVPLEELRKKKK